MKVHFKLFIIFLTFFSLMQAYCMDEEEADLRTTLTNYHPLKARALPKLDRALKDVFEKGNFGVFKELAEEKGISFYVKLSIYKFFLHRLIDKGDTNLVRKLLDFAERKELTYRIVNAQYGEKRESSLHLAIKNIDFPMVELLTQYYPNYTLEDRTGKRAFIAAHWDYLKKDIAFKEWIKKNIISKNEHFFHVIEAQETFLGSLNDHHLSEYERMEKEISSLIQIMKLIAEKEESSVSSKEGLCAQKFANGSHG